MTSSRSSVVSAAGVAALLGGAAFVPSVVPTGTPNLRATASRSVPTQTGYGLEAPVVVAGAALALLGRKAAAPTMKQLVGSHKASKWAWKFTGRPHRVRE